MIDLLYFLWWSSRINDQSHDDVQVGNAAYHDDRLYDQLQRCIPYLTRLLLEDEEDKTKANAAGALSNLVRNSSRLCDDIISKGAIQVKSLFRSYWPEYLKLNLTYILSVAEQYLSSLCLSVRNSPSKRYCRLLVTI